MAGPADGVPRTASEDRLHRTPVRVRSLHVPDPDLVGAPPSRDRTLVVLAGAVDDSGEGTRLVQVVDHRATAGRAVALLLVGADGPEDQVEVWWLRVGVERDSWIVAAAGCPASSWPRWDPLLRESVGLPDADASVPADPVAGGRVEVVVEPADAEPSGFGTDGEPGRSLGRLLAATGWDATAPPDAPGAPEGSALVGAGDLDDLLLDGRPDALAGLPGPWASALSRCAGAEVLRWRVGAVVVVDCGSHGLLRLGTGTGPRGGRRPVLVTGVSRAEAFALAAAQLAGPDEDRPDDDRPDEDRPDEDRPARARPDGTRPVGR